MTETPNTPSAPRTRDARDARDEDRAWYRLALDLRSVAPDCAAAPGIDYERLANRVQTSTSACDLPHDYGRGHVAPDRVAERLERIAGRPGRVLRWLRSFGPALEWLRADTVDDKRGALLDALATGAGAAEIADVQRWAAADKPVDARRQWSRIRLREAWSAWTGEAW